MTMADEGEIIGHVLYEQTDDVDTVDYFVERTVVYVSVEGQCSLFYIMIGPWVIAVQYNTILILNLLTHYTV